MNADKPIFFIYSWGFKQISLPAKEENKRTISNIHIKFSKYGSIMQTEEDMQTVCDDLNYFSGRRVINIWCDENEIHEDGTFLDAVIRDDKEYGRVIYYRVKHESDHIKVIV